MATKKEAYLSLSAMLRAREPKLLGAERASRMLDAASFEEAAKLLTDCGYGDLSGCSAAEIEQALVERRNRIFTEMDAMAPDRGIVDLFRMKYDVHNAKTVLKAEATGQDPLRIMSASGRIAPQKLLEAYREERVSELPKLFGEALLHARETLARTENPQKADFELDKAYFAEMKQTADSVGGSFLKGYVSLLIDTANLRSAVRTLRMKKSADFLQEVLIHGGSVDPARIAAAADGEALAALFASDRLADAAALGAQAAAGGAQTAFERSCDNAVNRFLRSAKLVSYGIEPLIAYLAAVEGEITAVRMILTGRLAGIAPETIRERLRDLYA